MWAVLAWLEHLCVLNHNDPRRAVTNLIKQVFPSLFINFSRRGKRIAMCFDRIRSRIWYENGFPSRQWIVLDFQVNWDRLRSWCEIWFLFHRFLNIRRCWLNMACIFFVSKTNIKFTGLTQMLSISSCIDIHGRWIWHCGLPTNWLALAGDTWDMYWIRYAVTRSCPSSFTIFNAGQY